MLNWTVLEGRCQVIDKGNSECMHECMTFATFFVLPQALPFDALYIHTQLKLMQHLASLGQTLKQYGTTSNIRSVTSFASFGKMKCQTLCFDCKLILLRFTFIGDFSL